MKNRLITAYEAFLVLGLVFLNLFDAFATLRHVQYGAKELNPLMAYLLSIGPVVFMSVKHSLMAVCVFLILIVPSKTKYVLPPVFGVFFSLGLYQIWLFTVTR